MNILVTGGAGNIASALVAGLAKDDQNLVVVADNLSTGDLSKVPVMPNVVFVKCDVNDFNDISPLFYFYKFDYVFHFAATVGVARTLEHPIRVLDDIKGIEHILKLSKNLGVRRLYYSSSSEVYGESIAFPQDEYHTPLNSRLPYAIVKNLGEAYCKVFHKEYGLEYTIFRFFNTYGPNQSEDFVVPRFIKRALHNEDITVYGDGSQTRTFCFVEDTVDTCIAIHNSGAMPNDVINIGSDREISILELAKIIITLTGSSSRIVHLPPLKEGDMTRRKPDNGKMRAILQRELIPLEEGINKLVAYYLAKEAIAL